MVESTELVGAGQVADTEVVALDGSTAEDLPAEPIPMDEAEMMAVPMGVLAVEEA